MIIEEQFNKSLVRHYSNKGVKIKQIETGLIYEEAIDNIPCKYSYEETDILIIYDEEEAK